MNYKFMSAIGSCLLAPLLLVGCATQYQPDGLTGGYSDTALAKDMYAVSFRGNAYTSSDNVKLFLLRRCAELTVNNGYKYFVVLQVNNAVNSNLIQTPTTIRSSSDGSYQGYSYGGGYYGNGNVDTTTTINPGYTEEVDRYKDTVIIKMLMTNKDSPTAIDANIVQNQFPHKQISSPLNKKDNCAIKNNLIVCQ